VTTKRPTVLQSFVAIRETTNPYQSQLVQALGAHVDVRLFSWRAALLGRIDVLHVHWPEVLIRDRNVARTSVRRVLFLLVLIRLRLGGKALVRTLHNVAPHEPGTEVENSLLRLCDRWTTTWIALNEFTRPPTDAPTVVIPHGHYRDWFAKYPAGEVRSGRILYFGRVRRYKGVADLVAAFRAIEDPSLTLRIVGSPDDAQTAALVEAAAGTDSRITADLRHVTDAEAASEFGRAELLVLPYRDMHNSGTALLALSFARPVLVPRTDVTEALAREVGPEWVIRYDGPMDADQLRAAGKTVHANPPPGVPDLHDRDWDEIGRAHARAFERAAKGARLTPRLTARSDKPRPHG
jgi:beta-1,4-mannosyltransferase